MASLGRTPRLVDAVVERLREGIVTGQLPAGTQLLQVELAEQLGVSRTPLREAFRVLESDGVVRTSDNDRAVEVVTIGADDMRDMFELREVIDGLAARLAAKHGLSEPDEREANTLLDELDVTTDRYVPEERNRLDTEFHVLIARASRNTKVVESFLPLIRTSCATLYMPTIRQQVVENAEVLERSATFKAVLRASQQEHRAILTSILAGDQKQAEKAARSHVRRMRHVQRTLHLSPDLNQLLDPVE